MFYEVLQDIISNQNPTPEDTHIFMSCPGEFHAMKLIVVGNLGERELLRGPLFQKVAEDGTISLGKELHGKRGPHCRPETGARGQTGLFRRRSAG